MQISMANLNVATSCLEGQRAHKQGRGAVDRQQLPTFPSVFQLNQRSLHITDDRQTHLKRKACYLTNCLISPVVLNTRFYGKTYWSSTIFTIPSGFPDNSLGIVYFLEWKVALSEYSALPSLRT